MFASFSDLESVVDVTSKEVGSRSFIKIFGTLFGENGETFVIFKGDELMKTIRTVGVLSQGVDHGTLWFYPGSLQELTMIQYTNTE